jgi:Flp pilus assembly protein TadD/cytochrome c553
MTLWYGGTILVTAVILTWLWLHSPENSTVGREQDSAATAQYIGGQACAQCHTKEYEAWRGSHHELAMQPANEKTVLGNFANAKFTYGDITSTFFKRDDKFTVRTDGPDGKLAEFEIRYTFGVAPLQQYLIELPGGRLQALSIAWDSRPQAKGGQRWFHLYPNERITYTDELHWTGMRQNWNFMCAECHSTNLQKNYDAQKREYKTSWSEINVSCEACHGPASGHVVWAREQPPTSTGQKAYPTDPRKGLTVVLDERKNIHWSPNPETGNAQRSSPRTTSTEIQLCARCHSRRAQLFGDYQPREPLMNSYLPSLLVQGLYYSDGQINDEVYEYGSFIQSRMYHAGVTCSDCHEPHSGNLRAEGNVMCATCHSPEKYQTATHHHHETGSAGAACVNCHMPTKTYMIVDPRRDHSFRIPRPELSTRLGTLNACNDCHKDKPSQWAANKVREWYGHDPQGYQRFAEALHAARTDALQAESRLVNLTRDAAQPAIARATAVTELGSRLTPRSIGAVADSLHDSDPLVRAAALDALEHVQPEQRWQIAHDLLRDPVRAVRMRAAGLLAGVRTDSLAPEERNELQKASEEYLAAQKFNADDPAAWVNLGIFYLARADTKKAEEAYRAALALDPGWVPAYVNLADLMRAINRDGESEKILRAGTARQPKAAALHHSLGLLQVRQKNLPGALESLKRATELAPENARYSYVYAVALHSSGNSKAAITRLKNIVADHPADRDALEALTSFYNQRGNIGEAEKYAARLRALLENDKPS